MTKQLKIGPRGFQLIKQLRVTVNILSLKKKFDGIPLIGGSTYVGVAYDFAELLLYVAMQTYI